ncbi:MAG: ABC transporter ATP-binding protein [Desulfuromonas sp.]|nr:ABC transporter ATP-binding protein [Desulfuromonas sp.]
MSSALEINQLSKAFTGQAAVKRLSLSIKDGEIFGLLGPNGAGKSTTINMIAGVSRIDSGSVHIFGHDSVVDCQHARRLTGVMHQELTTDAFFTIDKALRMHPGFFGVRADAQWRELLVERLELQPHLHKPMNCLSGGMKRRFMLAKALIHKPRLLILDEPTAGVDVELRHTIWQFIREINRHDTTILLTTHYLEEAEQMCNRIAIMNHGELIALDSTTALLNQLDARQVRLLLCCAIDHLPPQLVQHHARLDDGGKTIILPLQSGETVCAVLELCRTLKLPICDVETCKPNLEEVFLHLTQPDRYPQRQACR